MAARLVAYKGKEILKMNKGELLRTVQELAQELRSYRSLLDNVADAMLKALRKEGKDDSSTTDPQPEV